MLAFAGCASEPNEIIGPASAPPAATAPIADHADLTYPASAATTAATGITSWVAHELPDGGHELRGLAGATPRYVVQSPHYDVHTAGSIGIVLIDATGKGTQGWLTVRDGAIVDQHLPAGAEVFAQHMQEDLAKAPALEGWSDCNNARSAQASAESAVAWAQAAAVAAGAAVIANCVTPAVVVVANCVAATAAEAAALAALQAAQSALAQADVAVHSACDNLCTSDSWCSSRYGSGWGCNSEGTCEQVTTTVCFSCQTVSCGWDFTCASGGNAPAYCGDCGGGGGGGGGYCELDCNDVCDGQGFCGNGYCLCGT